ncbi:hypothetical protein [Maribacter sp. 2308TA10-17]|uniref:hypothetical protein n=1 Tax=Maribacter sp. 2308TA10-17 TaxID=3386276 RepID=UPI0039BD355D
MKKLLLFFLILQLTSISAQVENYNLFPSMAPSHLLDDKLEDISFAFGLRVLESDYNGPLIRLRRANDNSEMDFFCRDDDKVDIEAINTWRNGANVFVTRWYDQSGLGRDAFQTTTFRQPRFIPDATQPYWAGDGNDVLIVPENFQNLTESGKNGSVLGIFYATDRSQIPFGVISGGERWLVHINWNNEQCYFDPGYCCNNPRSFINNLPTHPTNPGSLNAWDQYSFVRRDNPSNTNVDKVILRLKGVQKANGNFPNNQSCNLTFNFGLGSAISNSFNTPSQGSTTRFAEIIMYKVGLQDDQIDAIEQNQITFWNL